MFQKWKLKTKINNIFTMKGMKNTKVKINFKSVSLAELAKTAEEKIKIKRSYRTAARRHSEKIY